MITALFLVLFSLSGTSTAVNLCDEVVATLYEFREYTDLTDDQVRSIAGRCYTDYVDSQTADEEENK